MGSANSAKGRRFFWKLLRALPKILQDRIIRNSFEVDYSLPENLIFKHADTVDEVTQALSLVYQSYLELNYINESEAKIRFNKFLSLPSTIILIAKVNNEVIATLSIIPDSALGLPSEAVWPINKYRQGHKLLVELSALSIKKDFKLRRGRLLFSLCKFMYLYCRRVIEADGLLISTAVEVEPFYTSILMFEKVVTKTGQKNSSVNNNPSTCCFLPLNQNTENLYKKIYNKKTKNKNLYHFFVEFENLNFRFPTSTLSLQSHQTLKNQALNVILRNYPELTKDFSEFERNIIKNLDTQDLLPIQATVVPFKKIRKFLRIDVRLRAWIFLPEISEPIQCQIIDISEAGVQFKLDDPCEHLMIGKEFSTLISFAGHSVSTQFIVRRNNSNCRIGAEVVNESQEWAEQIAKLYTELNLKPLPQRLQKKQSKAS